MCPEAITPDTKDWTWVLDRRCSECGFAASATRPADVAVRLLHNAAQWRMVLSREDVRERPDPAVWSPLEYGCHVRDVHRVMFRRVVSMLQQDSPTFANWDQDATAVEDRYTEQDPAVVAEELVSAAESIGSVYAGVSGAAWDRPGLRGDGSRFTVASISRYHLHDAVHHLIDVGHVA